MAAETVPQGRPAALSESRDTDRLIQRLEKEADRIAGKRRLNFVDTKSLCTSCSHAGIVRQESKNHRTILCFAIYNGNPAPDDIMECSSYQALTGLSLRQMANLAHIIETRDTNQGYL